MVDTALQKLVQQTPGLQEELDSSLGYLVVDKKVVKIPFVGGGGGKGVVVENATGKRTYVKVSRMEVGGGWGARSYKVLLVFTKPKRLEKAQAGTWVYQAGAEASAGKVAAEGSSAQVQKDKGYKVYTYSEGGASVTWTLRAFRLKPYRD